MGKGTEMRTRLLGRAGLGLSAIVIAGAALPATAAADQPYRYPLRGPHNYGNLETTGFGMKRSDGSVHHGQDILASCGTPVVAHHRRSGRRARFAWNVIRVPLL